MTEFKSLFAISSSVIPQETRCGIQTRAATVKGQVQGWKCASGTGFEPLPAQQPLGPREQCHPRWAWLWRGSVTQLSFNDNSGLSFGSILGPSDPCLVSMRYRKAGPSPVASAPGSSGPSYTSFCHPGVWRPALRTISLFLVAPLS